MTKLSPRQEETLLEIYVGQNIRDYGMLQSEVGSLEAARELLSLGLVKENHWHLDQFLTTQQGSELGKILLDQKLGEKEGQLQTKIEGVPERTMAFLTKRHISTRLDFSTLKPEWSDRWEDHVLADRRIWMLWNGLFTTLQSFGFCVKTHNYVSTRGGELRNIHYVISSETQEFLSNRASMVDFDDGEEHILGLYPVLRASIRILASDQIDAARQMYYEQLKSQSIAEAQLSPVINEMSKTKITTEYLGLLSERKPFEILDSRRFEIYLERNLIDPAVRIILGEKATIRDYGIGPGIQTLAQVKAELGILEDRELGDFYLLVSRFEQELREFIKQKVGEGWPKRLEKDLPKVIDDLKDKNKRDEKWGIEPEKDLMNYADLSDYEQIIKKYDRSFCDGPDDLGDILAQMRIWYNQGRNPIMHARTVNRQKYFTAKSAIEYLREWMNRKQRMP